MRRRLAPLLLLALLATGLSSCAAGPEPDWQTLEGSANDFMQRASAVEHSLGGGSLRLTEADRETEEGGGVTLEYEPGTRVDSATVACFGEGSARFGFAVRTGASWIGRDSVDVTCDGSEIEVPISETVDAVRFDALLTDGAGAVVTAAVSGAAE